jgi:3-isopropylmalate/(R)-2-methylmalate dehydratase large subunit
MSSEKIDQVYIGSCTNGRIEDLRIAAEILEGQKIKNWVRGIVSPASPAIFNKALEEGIIKIFMDAGFCVTNPTCGACLGMSNGVLAEGEVCASTTNRNFNGRMGKGGVVHLMSPATAAASALTGYITNSSIYKAQGSKI